MATPDLGRPNRRTGEQFALDDAWRMLRQARAEPSPEPDGVADLAGAQPAVATRLS